ncbi:MAG: type II toxin-antitoxin system RelE/ParE family toxin [Spirochaetia bacterium]|nr:type II toxin-antitoxin system RelE/ParE family toxin [Spirochaetia bacterium]
MAFKIKWLSTAVDDLEEICSYIAKDSEKYAIIIARSIYEIVEDIAKFPERGRVVPEYNRKEIREIIYKSYRIIYRIRDNYIQVLAVYHGARILKFDF